MINPAEELGRLTPLTLFTAQLLADVSLTALGAGHPRSHLPGRAVTHVLAVAAVQFGYPIALFIGVKTGDRSFDHAVPSCEMGTIADCHQRQDLKEY